MNIKSASVKSKKSPHSFIICFVFLAFLLNQNIFSQDAQNPLIQKWESFEKTRTGMGTILEFKSDSTVIFTKAAMLNYLYGYKNGKLITSLVNFVTMQSQLDTTEVKISGDTLTQLYNVKDQKKIRTMFRVSGEQDSIIGKWKSKNNMGQTYYYDFRDDHTMFFRLPFEIKKGKYSIKNNYVTIEYENSSPIKMEFRIVKNNLILTSKDKKITHSYHVAF